MGAAASIASMPMNREIIRARTDDEAATPSYRNDDNCPAVIGRNRPKPAVSATPSGRRNKPSARVASRRIGPEPCASQPQDQLAHRDRVRPAISTVSFANKPSRTLVTMADTRSSTWMG
jgi:hypothetical protein